MGVARVLACALALGGLWACGSADGDGGGLGRAGSSGGDGDGDGMFGNAGNDLGSTGGFNNGTAAVGGNGGVGGMAGGTAAVGSGPGECGGDAYQAEAKPLHIYTLYDDSGSMIPWWIAVGDAFIQFVNDPRSQGISVGLKFFGSSCDANTYAQPEVPIGPVTQNAMTLANTIQTRAPFSGTATTPALQGGLQAALAHQQQNPDAKVILLLVTDGAPDDCGSTIDTASMAAQQAAAQGIPTYVLGLGNVAGLDALAMAGGTGTALSADPTMVNAVVEKMNAIRGQALPCDYKLPDNTEDPALVNLQFVAGGNQMAIPGLGSADECAAQGGGWYYDDPGAPTRLLACEQTCQQFKSSGDAQVNVVLGCPTIKPD